MTEVACSRRSRPEDWEAALAPGGPTGWNKVGSTATYTARASDVGVETGSPNVRLARLSSGGS